MDPIVAFVSGWTALAFAWLIGIIVWIRRSFRNVVFDLGGDVLRIRKGIWMRKIAVIPLSQVHGFVVRSGPLLGRYGLSTVRIRTGPSRAGAPWDEATLPGVADAAAVVASLEERRAALTRRSDASVPTLRPVSPVPKATPR